MYGEHSTYSSRYILERLIKTAPFKTVRIQTDKGSEFMNWLRAANSQKNTLFENGLIKHGIEYQRIRETAPRHNGKAERQHRQDSERLCERLRMYGHEDYQRLPNNIIKTCLGMKSRNAKLKEYS